MPIIFAHSAGYWDEFIFLGIAVIFTIVMGVGWWRSRGFDDEYEENEK